MKKSGLLIFCIVFLFSCTKDKVGGNLPFPDIICSDTVSFNNEILPLIQNNCTGCHTNQNGYTFTNHANISFHSTAIIGSMRNNGYQLMPKGGPALIDSIIQRMECWVKQGKLNN
ncbi:MAG: hypothetical protein ACKN86_08665 [Crocinitomicaceae bacterium]